MTLRRHLVPAVAIAALVAACGSDGTPSDPATTTRATSTAPATAMSADSPAPVDVTTLPPPVVAEFRLGGELEQLDDRGTVWAWSPATVVTREQVGALAVALGVDGEVTEQPAADGGGFTVGNADGPRLSVSADAQGSWSFSAPSAVTCAVDTTHTTLPAVAPAPDVVCSPPADVPAAADGEVRAGELLVVLGLDPAGYSVTVATSEDGAWVDAALVLDGVPTQVNTSFALGRSSALSYASGQLFAPEQVGETSLIGTEAGYARLQSDFLMRAYSPVPGSQDPPRSARPDTGVTAEPALVTIVAVEPDWWTSWSEDGAVTLHPAYTFVTDHGERLTIPAVPDDQLPPELIAEPAVVADTDVETAPGG